MAKTENNADKTQARKTQTSKTDFVGPIEVDNKVPTEETLVKGPAPKPSTEMAPVMSAEDRQVMRHVGAKLLTSVQVDGSVAISCPADKAVDLALKHGAQGLVDEFAPTDAVESTLAPVIVGIRNAV